MLSLIDKSWIEEIEPLAAQGLSDEQIAERMGTTAPYMVGMVQDIGRARAMIGITDAQVRVTKETMQFSTEAWNAIEAHLSRDEQNCTLSARIVISDAGSSIWLARTSEALLAKLAKVCEEKPMDPARIAEMLREVIHED